jgi:hypothetical protein
MMATFTAEESDKILAAMRGANKKIDQLRAERDRLAAELVAAREALAIIKDKAGSHTVTKGAFSDGESDPGYAGIFSVASNALSSPAVEKIEAVLKAAEEQERGHSKGEPRGRCVVNSECQCNTCKAVRARRKP